MEHLKKILLSLTTVYKSVSKCLSVKLTFSYPFVLKYVLSVQNNRLIDRSRGQNGGVMFVLNSQRKIYKSVT